MNNYLKLIKQLGQKHHTIKSARILQRLGETSYLVSVLKGKRNIVENVSHVYQDLYLLSQEKFELINEGDLLINNPFESHKHNRVAKLQKLGDEKKKNVLEIYIDGCLEQSVNLSKYHEDVLNDEMVGQPLQWNKEGNKLLYLAKLKAPEALSFFNQESDSLEKGWEYRKYEQSFGERMDDVYKVGLFEYDLQEQKIYRIQIEDDLFVTFPQYDGEGAIIFGAYKIHPEFKYGIVHCFNRLSTIYYCQNPERQDLNAKSDKNDIIQQDVKSKLDILSNQHAVSIKPCISPDYKKMIYFGAPLHHQHLTYLSLNIIDLQSKQSEELIAIPSENLVLEIREDLERRNSLINGICGYYDDLMKIYWTKDSSHFIFPSIVASQQGIFAININNKSITKLSQNQQNNFSNNFNTLDYNIEYDTLIYTQECIAQPQQLSVIMNITQYLTQPNTPLVKLYQKSDLFEGFSESYIYSGEAEGFIWKLKEQTQDLSIPTYFKNRPLMVLIHGGPHGASQSEFTLLRSILLQQGFIILAPNFTGSAGYGQTFLHKLSGQIGELDAKEIVDMINQTKKIHQIDEKHVFVMGGSYGGYMSAIMASRYSDLFKASIILNPVTNIPFMMNITDIPEWSTSCALNKEYSWDLNGDDYKEMFDKSPMKESIKIPSLLLIGAKDRRCPYQQSLALRSQTIANGVEIETYVYPESDHSLSDSLITGFDTLAKMVLFLNKHMN